MSSLRVRAQNKLLNKLGAAKPSKNVQFDTAFAAFEKTHAGVAALEAALRGFVVSLKGFHVSAQVLYGAIETVGGTPENSPEMKQTVAELKNAFLHVDVKALEDSVRRFESRVLRPASGWMGRAAALRNQVADFHEEKLGYDHYTRKVMALREARDKRSAAGKQEKPKDVEKIVRNEQKLAATTNAYAKISEATVANLRDFVNSREATLAPIVQRVLEFRVQYAARVADESRLLQQMVRHDTAFDGVLGALEAFVAQVTGAPGPSSAHTDAPTREPEPPVQALSFESFVGEATPPPHKAASSEWLPPDMPPLPPPPPHRNSAGYAANVATALHPPASPSGANDVFSDFVAPMSPQSTAMAAFHTAPVQPLPVSSGGFTPWDDIAPPPPPPANGGGVYAAPPQFHTTPASASAPSFGGWDSFTDVGGAPSAFQQMHQHALH